jgi:hypothetical protein
MRALPAISTFAHCTLWSPPDCAVVLQHLGAGPRLDAASGLTNNRASSAHYDGKIDCIIDCIIFETLIKAMAK